VISTRTARNLLVLLCMAVLLAASASRR